MPEGHSLPSSTATAGDLHCRLKPVAELRRCRTCREVAYCSPACAIAHTGSHSVIHARRLIVTATISQSISARQQQQQQPILLDDLMVDLDGPAYEIYRPFGKQKGIMGRK